MNYKTFQTDRLHLRPTTVDDAPFILELLNTPKFHKYIGDRKVRSIPDAEKYIQEKMLPQLSEKGYSNYTIIRLSDNEKLGTCGLYAREGLEDVDIGFAFLPQHEKQGYAFEAAAKLKEAAENVFHLTRLCAITTKDNFDSQKLLEKLGFQFEKLTFIPNDEEELMLYGWRA